MEDVKEDVGVEEDVLLAASGRDPRFSAGTLQRGIPIPRCCLWFIGSRNIMAFGLSRHRAWVVGQSPQGRFLGSLRRALRGPPGGEVLWHFGSLLGLPGGLLRRKV